MLAVADLRAMPVLGLTYGLFFTLVGAGLFQGLQAIERPYLILPFTFGFFLVGPALACGLYEASRQRAAGERPTLRGTLFAFRPNAGQVFMGGGLLMVSLMGWVRLSLLIFMLFFAFQVPTLDQVVARILGTSTGWAFLATFLAVGAVFAGSIYVSASLAFPLMLDRPTANVMDGIITSWRAMRVNPGAMVAWAAVIVVLTFLGMASFYLGLIIVMPLLAHGSWHAYRDLVERPGGADRDQSSP
jgi:uncharacterized membrane protein